MVVTEVVIGTVSLGHAENGPDILVDQRRFAVAGGDMVIWPIRQGTVMAMSLKIVGKKKRRIFPSGRLINKTEAAIRQLS